MGSITTQKMSANKIIKICITSNDNSAVKEIKN